MRLGKILRLQSNLTPGKCGLPLHNRGLPPGDFMLGNTVDVLRLQPRERKGNENDDEEE